MLQKGRTKVEWARWRHILYGFNTAPTTAIWPPWPNVLVSPLTLTRQKWLGHITAWEVNKSHSKQIAFKTLGSTRADLALNEQRRLNTSVHNAKVFYSAQTSQLSCKVTEAVMSRAEPESLITIHNIAKCKLDCSVYLWHHTFRWLWLLTWVYELGFVTIQEFSFHVWPFAFMLQVTWITNYRS